MSTQRKMQKRERIKYLNQLIIGEKKEQTRLSIEKLADINVMQFCGRNGFDYHQDQH